MNALIAYILRRSPFSPAEFTKLIASCPNLNTEIPGEITLYAACAYAENYEAYEMLIKTGYVSYINMSGTEAEFRFATRTGCFGIDPLVQHVLVQRPDMFPMMFYNGVSLWYGYFSSVDDLLREQAMKTSHAHARAETLRITNDYCRVLRIVLASDLSENVARMVVGMLTT